MAHRSKSAAANKQPANPAASPAAQVALFELEDWEKRELQEGQLSSHSLLLSGDPLRPDHSEFKGDSVTPAEVISVVVITPHLAFNSRQAVRRILQTTVANTMAFLEGKPQNVVGS